MLSSYDRDLVRCRPILKKQKQSKAKNPTKQSINQFRRRWTKVREVEGKGKGKEKQDIQ
jgi:hypothetical protein